ncbi:MAG: hypothetical protein J7L88_03630 [Thermoplasmata archaeon]|nr:hypothetical protein [Thermoplasmata archaeon]
MAKKKRITIIERRKANRLAGMLAIASGILLFISGITGVAAWKAVQAMAERYLGGGWEMDVAFSILLLLASLGGILVILGGFLLYREKVRLGKFIITIGVGFGALGFIFQIMTAFLKGQYLNISGSFIGFFGIFFSILARVKAQKVEIQILD